MAHFHLETKLKKIRVTGNLFINLKGNLLLLRYLLSFTKQFK